jgi:hypothetical protein
MNLRGYYAFAVFGFFGSFLIPHSRLSDFKSPIEIHPSAGKPFMEVQDVRWSGDNVEFTLVEPGKRSHISLNCPAYMVGIDQESHPIEKTIEWVCKTRP